MLKHLTGRVTSFVGSDGVKRTVSLSRVGDGTIQLNWETWWNGEDKEKFAISVRLSMPALNATMSVLAEFQHDPGSFPQPEEEEE
jgi:hypothetical protein